MESEEEKKSNEAQIEQNKDLLDFMKESLSDKVAKVVLSQRLKSHPVCLSTEGEITLEMEKVLNAMPSGGNVKSNSCFGNQCEPSYFPNASNII